MCELVLAFLSLLSACAVGADSIANPTSSPLLYL